MKLGEIKLEALVLMNIISDGKLQLEKMSDYLNENKYKKYLLSMDQSINRAIDIINTRNVLKEKILDLKNLDYKINVNNVILTLNQINDFKKIKKIIKIGDCVENLKFETISDNLIIYTNIGYDDIKIVYYPKIVSFENLNDNDELPISNELARIIPYYVKYDLYQEDEPSLSMMAKTVFDSLILEYEIEELGEESEIQKVYEVQKWI